MVSVVKYYDATNSIARFFKKNKYDLANYNEGVGVANPEVVGLAPDKRSRKCLKYTHKHTYIHTLAYKHACNHSGMQTYMHAYIHTYTNYTSIVKAARFLAELVCPVKIRLSVKRGKFLVRK
jgi:hypothetical protein